MSHRWMLTVWVVVTASSCAWPEPPPLRRSLSLNGTWDFYPNGSNRRFDVRVPSFWDAPQDYGYPNEWLHMRHGVYRRKFRLPDEPDGQRVFLRIERLSVLGQVRVNGQSVGGETTGGYLMMQLPYLLDITDLLRPAATNDLEVAIWGGQSIVHAEDELDPDEIDFPPDAFHDGRLLFPYGVDHYDGRRGLNGDVELLVLPEVFIAEVQIITDLKNNPSSDDDEITIRVTVENRGVSEAAVMLQGLAVSQGTGRNRAFGDRALRLSAGARETVSWEAVSWTDALYWWPHAPHLYRLETRLLRDQKVADEVSTTFGFRQFYVVGNHFELNGKPVNLRGDAFEFSWHEGYRHGPATAPVISTKELVPDLQRKLLAEYRSLNMNVLRPHKASGIDELYDLCDATGMMVMDEAPFWETFQRTDERARYNYMEWIRRWVTERRNHPSIIMWVIANECRGSQLPEFNFHAAREIDATRPVFHHGVRPGDFEGDVECVQYTGGYPMQVFNSTDLYGIYAANPSKPRGEGESLFAAGWPLKAPDGKLTERRSARGEWNHPDLISQAEWVRGSARLIRAMRYAGLPDARLYADWWYCFEAIEDHIRPIWRDLTAPGIKPFLLRRPIANVFDPVYPEIRYNDGRKYWRDSYSAVAVFDLEHDRSNVIGAEPIIFRPGQEMTRRLVVFNDDLEGDTEITVSWAIGSELPDQSGREELTSGEIPLQVPLAGKVETSLSFRVPEAVQGTWLILSLRAVKQGRLLFEEHNRLGAVLKEPRPMVTAWPARFELGSLTRERAEQLRKIRLINAGGGRSVQWRLRPGYGLLSVNLSEGNLRGEQEVYFQVDPEQLEAGRSYEEVLQFDAGSVGTAEVHIRFSAE